MVLKRIVRPDAPSPARVAAWFVPLLLTMLGGCASLLPASREEVVSSWGSYEDAVRSIASLQPFASTRQDVHALGLDPRNMSSIRILHFADVLQRFGFATQLNPAELDRGIRECLLAGKRCGGYVVAVKKLSHARVGGFWSDSLDFTRVTETKGWNVEVFLVFVDDVLVYELIGGQPNIYDYEVHHNPLGPLQSWGAQAIPLPH